MDNATDCLWPRPQLCVSSAPVLMEIPLTKTLFNCTVKKQALHCKRTLIKLQQRDFHPRLEISRHTKYPQRCWDGKRKQGNTVVLRLYSAGDGSEFELNKMLLESEEKRWGSSYNLFSLFFSPFPLSFSLSLCPSVSLLLCATAYSHRETVGLCPLGEAGREQAGWGGVEEGDTWR